MLSQLVGSFKQWLEHHIGQQQLFIMRNISGSFDGKDKLLWYRLPPFLKSFCLRQVIKRCVEFQRFEMQKVIKKILSRLDGFGIKIANPITIAESRKADMNPRVLLAHN